MVNVEYENTLVDLLKDRVTPKQIPLLNSRTPFDYRVSKPLFIEEINYFSRSNENLLFPLYVEKDNVKVVYSPSTFLIATMMRYDSSGIEKMLGLEKLITGKRKIASKFYDLFRGHQLEKDNFVSTAEKDNGLRRAMEDSFPDGKPYILDYEGIDELAQRYVDLYQLFDNELKDGRKILSELLKNKSKLKKKGLANILAPYKLDKVEFSGHAITIKGKSKTDGKEYIINMKGPLVEDMEDIIRFEGNTSINSSVPITSFSQVKYEFDRLYYIDHYIVLGMLAFLGYDVARETKIKKDTLEEFLLDSLPIFIPFQPLVDAANGSFKLKSIIRRGLKRFLFDGWKRVDLDYYLLGFKEIYSQNVREWMERNVDEGLSKKMTAKLLGDYRVVGFEEVDATEVVNFKGDVEHRVNGKFVKVYDAYRLGDRLFVATSSGMRPLNNYLINDLNNGREEIFEHANIQNNPLPHTHIKLEWEPYEDNIIRPIKVLNVNGFLIYPWPYKMRKVRRNSTQSP